MRIGITAALLSSFAVACCLWGETAFRSVHENGAQQSTVTRAPATSLTPVVDPLGIDDQTLVVEATGRDFYWQFRLAGPDQRFGTSDDVQLGSELHLPLATKVTVLVSSADNVYALSIPELGLRRIAVPELEYRLDFQTTRAGRFEAVVDPMCSVRLYQDGPMGQVIVEARDEFEAWLNARPRRPTGYKTARR